MSDKVTEELEKIRGELPQGWRWAKVGELCDAIRGVTFGSGEASSMPVEDHIACLTTSAVQIEIDWSTARYIPVSTLANHSQILQKGDILVSTANSKALVGKSCLMRDSPLSCTFGAFVTLLRPNSMVVPSFMHWSLRTPQALAFFYERSSNTTGISNLRVSDLLSFAIALPPITEQKRIAAILTEQMEAVERAHVAAEAQLQAAKELPSVFLRSVFDSPEAKEWPVAPLGQVGIIGSGITLGKKQSEKAMREIPYLRVANVKDGQLDLADVNVIHATEAEIGKCRLKYGDLLLTEGGDPDKLGRGTFWQEELPECIHQNHIFRVRFDLESFSPRFLSAQMGSPYGKAYFLAHAKQTTGIATINQKVLANFPLMIPPLNVQQKIADHLDECMILAERTKQAVRYQLGGLNQMPTVLLVQAFSGKLTVGASETVALRQSERLFDRRGAVSAYAINRLHQQPTFGRTQHMKILNLLETHLDVPLEGEYERQAAGPFDVSIYKLEGIANKEGWFSVHERENGRGVYYTPGTNIADRLKAAEELLSDKREEMDRLLGLFAAMDTEQAEMVTTLHAAWNDFLLDGIQPTDDQIIREVRENWHERKQRFLPNELQDGLAYLRENGLVPRGIGPHTKISNSEENRGS